MPPRIGRIGSVTVFAVFFAARACADTGAAGEQIAKYRAHDRVTRAYASGVVNALIWANGLARNQQKPEVFCQTADPPMTVDDAVALTETYAATRPQAKDGPFALVVLQALIDAFPCAAPKP